ncbi:hypothetical protein D3C81_419380 [compost metagenome]
MKRSASTQLIVVSMIAAVSPPALASVELSETDTYLLGLTEQLFPGKAAPEYLELREDWSKGMQEALRLTRTNKREYGACLALNTDLDFSVTEYAEGEEKRVNLSQKLRDCGGLTAGGFHTHPLLGPDEVDQMAIHSDTDFMNFLGDKYSASFVARSGRKGQDNLCVLVKGDFHFENLTVLKANYHVELLKAFVSPSIKASDAGITGLANAAAKFDANLYCGVIGSRLRRIDPRAVEYDPGMLYLAAKATMLTIKSNTPGSMPDIDFPFTPQKDPAFVSFLRGVLSKGFNEGFNKESADKGYVRMLNLTGNFLENSAFGASGFVFPDPRHGLVSKQFEYRCVKQDSAVTCAVTKAGTSSQGKVRMIASYDGDSWTRVKEAGADHYIGETHYTDGTVVTGTWAIRNGKEGFNGKGELKDRNTLISGNMTGSEFRGEVRVEKPDGTWRGRFNPDGTFETLERLR